MYAQWDKSLRQVPPSCMASSFTLYRLPRTRIPDTGNGPHQAMQIGILDLPIMSLELIPACPGESFRPNRLQNAVIGEFNLPLISHKQDGRGIHAGEDIIEALKCGFAEDFGPLPFSNYR